MNQKHVDETAAGAVAASVPVVEVESESDPAAGETVDEHPGAAAAAAVDNAFVAVAADSEPACAAAADAADRTATEVLHTPYVVAPLPQVGWAWAAGGGGSALVDSEAPGWEQACPYHAWQTPVTAVAQGHCHLQA